MMLNVPSIGWLARLLYKGVHDDLSADLKKKVIMTNTVILINIVLFLIYASLYFTFGVIPLGAITLTLGISYIMFFQLTEKGHYDAARFACLTASTAAIFFYGSSIGREGGVQILLFPLLSFAFMLFGLSEYLKLAITALLAVLCFILLDATGYSLFAIKEFTDFQKQINFQITFVAALALTVMCIYVLTRVNDWMDAQLISEQDRLKEKEAHNRAINARLNAILESTKNVIFALDKSYKYISFNTPHRERMKSAFGVDITLDTRLTEIPEIASRQDQLLGSFKRALNGEQFSIEQKIEYATLEPSYFETTYNPIFDEHREIIGVAVFSNDITLKKRAEQEIIRAKQEAERAAKTKTEFLSNMSHEIRTPMNAVIGLTELLLSQDLDEKSKENLKVIKKSGESLMFLLNDVLDISKMEAGKITFESYDFDLHATVHDVVQIFNLSADDKKLRLNVNVDSHVPVMVRGDRNRLDQILVNLIGNAVKFTDKGEVKVSLRLISADDEGCHISFEISDTGIGIPADKLSYIFENFTQAFSDTTRKYGGTGLGLAITKNLVELYGGTINVESKMGFGSTFRLELPFKKAVEQVKRVLPPTISENDLEGMNVLIVDDNKVNQLLLIQILKKWKMKTETASHGEEALRILHKKKFDAVLMDLHMPEMNGFEAAERIRRDFPFPVNQIPIIAVTADAFEYAKEQGKQAGMNDYVVKPFKSAELFEVLRKNIFSMEQKSEEATMNS